LSPFLKISSASSTGTSHFIKNCYLVIFYISQKFLSSAEFIFKPPKSQASQKHCGSAKSREGIEHQEIENVGVLDRELRFCLAISATKLNVPTSGAIFPPGC